MGADQKEKGCPTSEEGVNQAINVFGE